MDTKHCFTVGEEGVTEDIPVQRQPATPIPVDLPFYNAEYNKGRMLFGSAKYNEAIVVFENLFHLLQTGFHLVAILLSNALLSFFKFHTSSHNQTTVEKRFRNSFAPNCSH